MRCLLRVLSGVVLLVLVPTTVLAQAAITGVVKDASGGVLPGVTVEAASPTLAMFPQKSTWRVRPASVSPPTLSIAPA